MKVRSGGNMYGLLIALALTVLIIATLLVFQAQWLLGRLERSALRILRLKKKMLLKELVLLVEDDLNREEDMERTSLLNLATIIAIIVLRVKRSVRVVEPKEKKSPAEAILMAEVSILPENK